MQSIVTAFQRLVNAVTFVVILLVVFILLVISLVFQFLIIEPIIIWILPSLKDEILTSSVFFYWSIMTWFCGMQRNLNLHLLQNAVHFTMNEYPSAALVLVILAAFFMGFQVCSLMGTYFMARSQVSQVHSLVGTY